MSARSSAPCKMKTLKAFILMVFSIFSHSIFIENLLALEFVLCYMCYRYHILS